MFEVFGSPSLQSRALTWTFSAPSTGADIYQFVVPKDAFGNSVTWAVRQVDVRVSTPSSGSTTFLVQGSSGSGAFSAFNLLSSALTISGSGTYENSSTTFAVSTLASGSKVRINFSAVDATHDGFVIQLLLGLVT